MANPKRIAIFLDGTWNTVNDDTNVWRMKSLCVTDPATQIAYYSQGVGTQFGAKIRGGLYGYGLDDEIIDAYKWLIDNFEAGDDIFIFGFSRGAYTARSLSGFISKCGLLSPGAPLSVGQLFARYRRRTSRTIRDLRENPNAPAGDPPESSVEDAWILRYCAAIDIKFVGVWDTVGALGVPIHFASSFNVSRYRFLETHLRLTNTFAFQALAVDEHRALFEPTLWTRTVAHDSKGPPHQRTLDEVEQRWFVGAHANVGGGYPNDILAQAPLKWLMEKASLQGLKFKSAIILDHFNCAITDSYGDFAYGLYRRVSRPYFRPIGKAPDVGTKYTTSTINETVDSGVFDRWRADTTYRPPNVLEWAARFKANPADLKQSVLASDPGASVA
jgi:uncharacterized protein (DUF2235 family)